MYIPNIDVKIVDTASLYQPIKNSIRFTKIIKPTNICFIWWLLISMYDQHLVENPNQFPKIKTIADIQPFDWLTLTGLSAE